jgi:hypothetical protein
MIIPAIMALIAMNNPGKDKLSLTSDAPLGCSSNVLVISGREAEMVIMDMMVRLLTNNNVAFTCQVSVFIIWWVKEYPRRFLATRVFIIVFERRHGVLNHLSFH